MRHNLALSYQHSIDFRINMTESKHKKMQKFENIYSKIYLVTKCTLGYITIWNLFSLGLKIAQQDSQYCTKLHNEMHNVLHNKIYWKTEFSLCFSFVKPAKHRVLKWAFKLLVERFR